MVWLEARGQELGTEHVPMLPDCHDLRLHVQVINRGHHGAPSGDSEGSILDGLRFLDTIGAGIGIPYWGGVAEYVVD